MSKQLKILYYLFQGVTFLYLKREKKDIKQVLDFELICRNLRSFECELVKLLYCEMISVFLKHPYFIKHRNVSLVSMPGIGDTFV